MPERVDVEFSSDGETCRGWLYRPDRKPPLSAIVMAHGLGGTREMRLDSYAERFVAEEYACLVFDYRHFGASSGEPRQLLEPSRQLRDWAAAVAYLRARPEIDPSRIALWGTSFSGGHVIATAARDSNIAAVVAQGPFTDGLASSLVMHPRSAIKLTALAIADTIGSWVKRKPVTVALAGPPGATALMTAPDAESGLAALVPADGDFQHEVAARVALQIPWYRPGRQAKKVKCPMMVCLCETDSVAPPTTSLRHLTKALDVEVKSYRDGHFDIYRGTAFERVIADQITFLHRKFPATPN